jgi:hypothetical protein
VRIITCTQLWNTLMDECSMKKLQLGEKSSNVRQIFRGCVSVGSMKTKWKVSFTSWYHNYITVLMYKFVTQEQSACL